MKLVFKTWWLLVSLLVIVGCERDYMFRGGTEGLSFSVDTVMFDTIFTSIGSATKHLRVYNPYTSDMTIDGIQLAGGEDSKFRINVNGIPGHQINDIPLRAGDSLFIFVEVTIDPVAGVNDPFVVMDSVRFFTKERVQDVKLVAYGQDVVLFRQDTLKSQRLTNEKPYLVYDWLLVDSNETLIVDPGVRMHFHKNASMFVLGSLKVNGTIDEPVVFSGSRLEDWYNDIPGQWGGIYLLPGSKNHDFDYAVIKGATIGLDVDSIGVNGDNPLYISNTRVEHIAKQGLLATSSSIVVSNSLFANCGSACVALTVGGSYEFYHTTIANFYKWPHRSTPALLISNYYKDKDEGIHLHNLQRALFSNSIIWGSLNNEIFLDFKNDDENVEKSIINYKFENSLLKTTIKIEDAANSKNFSNVVLNKNPLFVSANSYNYQLDTLSSALNAGALEVARLFPTDIFGNSRIENKAPDLGFAERQESQ